MTVLALDLGQERIGVAVNPTGGELILELPTIRTAEQDVYEVIANLVSTYHVDRIVAGIVRAPSPSMVQLCNTLREQLHVPLTFIDEVLTTKEAERQLQQAGVRGDSDARAAKLILEQYLKEEL